MCNGPGAGQLRLTRPTAGSPILPVEARGRLGPKGWFPGPGSFGRWTGSVDDGAPKLFQFSPAAKVQELILLGGKHSKSP